MMRALLLLSLALVACSKSHGGTDAPPSSACRASGSCTTGPACGNTCCSAREQCVNGTCMCGTHPACGAGDMCAVAIPMPDQTCGTICCGASQICPL